MRFPSYRDIGGKIPSMEACIRSICDFLPSLQVFGDNRTTSVTHYPKGAIVRARPQIAGSISQSGTAPTPAPSSTKRYWNIRVEDTSVSYVKTLYVGGGYFMRNGQIVSMNMAADGVTPLETTSIQGLPNNWWVLTESSTYYILLWQKWNYDTKTWDADPYLQWTNELPDILQWRQYGATNPQGYCLMGIARNHEVYSISSEIPTMFVVGRGKYLGN